MRLPRVLDTVRTSALEAAVLTGRLALYSTGVLAERPLAADPADLPGPRPVLLLHGFVDNRSVFTLLRRSLARHGWPHVVCANYAPWVCDVRAAAETLGRHIEELRERTGRQHVDIVGHSLGGLIARYQVQLLGGDDHVHTLVTLGTPHHGTRAVPAMSVHPVVRQMRPGSALLTELAAPAPGCRTRFVSFWSDGDQVVSPPESARLDHPDLRRRTVRVRGLGHLTLPLHRAVIARIRGELVAADGVTAPATSSTEVA